MSPPVWIDATAPQSGLHLWGMNLVERQVREMALRHCQRFRLFVTRTTRAAVEAMRGDLHRLYQVDIDVVELSEGEEFFDRLGETDEETILLAGDAVYDDRVLSYLLDEGSGHAVVEGERGALFLSPPQAKDLAACAEEWSQVLQWAHQQLSMRLASDLEVYVASLRLRMPAFIFQLRSEADVRPLDHLMYKRTFKGAIDGVARYGYYHLVRWITRQLARGQTSPNLYTVLSVLCVWIASPLIAWGYVGAGLATAWCGVILDSVDGKLARLRLHLSDAMGAFEHVAAMPGLGLWFLATGWFLSGGQLVSLEPVAIATWVLLILFLLDKICSGLFKKWVGRELFDYRPIDAFFHLIAARRNVALLLLSVGALSGALESSFYALVGWMAVTLGFHLTRSFWVMFSLRV